MSESATPIPAEMSDDDLRAATGGCTELSCMYHHEFVAEIRRRNSTKERRS